MEKNRYPFHPIPPEKQAVPPPFCPQTVSQSPMGRDKAATDHKAAVDPMSHEDRSCRYDVGEPYPPTICTQKNIRYAQLLRMDFSAPQGKLTAVTQYLYQSWVAQEKAPELAQALREIAHVEMRHLELLGKLIFSLGGTPSYTYWSGARNFVWTGAAVRYDSDPVSMIRFDLMAERGAVAGYERRMAAIQDDRVLAVLRRIILDEKLHIQVLEKFLQQYGKTK